MQIGRVELKYAKVSAWTLMNIGLSLTHLKRRNRHRPLDRQRLTKRLDSFDCVHCFGGEVGLSAVATRPRGHAFDHEQVGTFAEAAGHVFDLKGAAAAKRALVFNRRRQ